MEKYRQWALKCGAKDAYIIDPKRVETVPWAAEMCKEGCEDYGMFLSCPPFAPEYTETREKLMSYSSALLFSSSDIMAITPLSRLFRDYMKMHGESRAFAFGGGSCRLCRECNKIQCAFPHLMLPSIEACGIDVFGTLKKLGIDPKNDCFGLVLIG